MHQGRRVQRIAPALRLELPPRELPQPQVELPDRLIVRILSSLLERNVSAGGVLFFTNIARPNPHRIIMQYFCDWVVIERSAQDLQGLVAHAGVPVSSVSVEYEGSGVTHLVTVVK